MSFCYGSIRKRALHSTKNVESTKQMCNFDCIF